VVRASRSIAWLDGNCSFHPVTFTTGSSNGSLMPDTVDTGTWAPDDGWRYHPKHVEQFTDINKLYYCILLDNYWHKKYVTAAGFITRDVQPFVYSLYRLRSPGTCLCMVQSWDYKKGREWWGKTSKVMRTRRVCRKWFRKLGVTWTPNPTAPPPPQKFTKYKPHKLGFLRSGRTSTMTTPDRNYKL